MPRIYFEDIVPGSITTCGPRTITREEIIAFASEFDPQPMHLDEEAAKKTMLGGLSASGWHTCAIMMRLIYDGFAVNAASMGAPAKRSARNFCQMALASGSLSCAQLAMGIARQSVSTA